MFKDIDGFSIAVEAKANVGTFASKVKKNTMGWVQCSRAALWERFMHSLNTEVKQRAFSIFISNHAIDYAKFVRMRERYVSGLAAKEAGNMTPQEFETRYDSVEGLLREIESTP